MTSSKEIPGDRRMQHYSSSGSGSDAYRHSYSLPSSATSSSYAPELYKAKKASKSSRMWSYRNDPEVKRKKRVASYKVYSVEAKMKDSVRSSFRWIKHKYLEIRYGWF